MSAMDEMGDMEQEPFVVLPMQQVNPNFNIDVNKMYDQDQHPGKYFDFKFINILKDIQAFDSLRGGQC